MQKTRSHEWDVGIQGCRINGGRINEGRLYKNSIRKYLSLQNKVRVFDFFNMNFLIEFCNLLDIKIYKANISIKCRQNF